MQPKAQVLDAAGIGRALARITHEIIERNRGVEDICLLGVRRRGEPLAHRLADNIERFEGRRVPLGYLDITCHRDDLSDAERQGIEREQHVPCDVSERTVILVDDVLYTGRTARAAMEVIFEYGRPAKVELHCLADRGGRQLPIHPDYAAFKLDAPESERVQLTLQEIDGKEELTY